MKIAEKNINGMLKTLKRLNKKYKYLFTQVTKNYSTSCYSFTLISEIISEIKERGQINLNSRGLWDTIRNDLWSDNDSFGNIYSVYNQAREWGYIK